MPQTSSTSFGMKAELPALPRRDDVLANKGAAAPKPCPSPVEMRALTVTGGLLPTGKAPTATRIIFYQSRLWFCPTKEINSRINNQIAPFWRRVIQTKSSQTLVFDPGGSTGCLCSCPLLEAWHALLYGEIFYKAPDSTRGWSVFWQMDDSEYHFSGAGQVNCLRRTYCGRSLFLRSQAGLNMTCRQSSTARGYMSCGGERMSGNAMERRV